MTHEQIICAECGKAVAAVEPVDGWCADCVKEFDDSVMRLVAGESEALSAACSCVRCEAETDTDCGSQEFLCDYCRKDFDASRLCRACYYEPYPLRLCPVCIDAIKEI